MNRQRTPDSSPKSMLMKYSQMFCKNNDPLRDALNGKYIKIVERKIIAKSESDYE